MERNAIAMIAMMVQHFYPDSDTSSFEYLLAFIVMIFFWGIGLCGAYILFVLRIYTTFKDSAYHSSKYIYMTLYLAIIIWFICHLILIAIKLLEYYKIISFQTEEQIHASELIVKCIALSYVSGMLIYLFVSKLITLTLSSYDTEIIV